MKLFFYCCCLGLAACLSGGWEGAAVSEEARLQGTLLDVGQGLSVLLQTEQGVVLYDTGPDSAGLVDTLRNRNLRRIDAVVISHWHRDHAAGFTEIAQAVGRGELQVKRLLYSGDTAGALWRDSVLGECMRLEIPVRELSRGDTVATLAPFGMRVLWPPSGEKLGENAASLVLRISDGALGWLLMGDAEAAQEARILELEPMLHAEVLQVGHHGSRTSSSWNFLAQVQPRIALMGVGRSNPHGHPHAETMAKLRTILPDTATLFRTDLDGSIELEWGLGLGVWPLLF